MSLSLVFSFFNFILKHYISLDLIISLSNCTELMLLFSLSHSPSITFFSCDDDYSFAVSCVPENNFFPPSWRVFIIFTHNRGERNEKNSTVDRRIFFWFSHFFFFLLSAFFLSHHENLIFFRKSFTFFMFQQLRWHEN